MKRYWLIPIAQNFLSSRLCSHMGGPLFFGLLYTLRFLITTMYLLSGFSDALRFDFLFDALPFDFCFFLAGKRASLSTGGSKSVSGDNLLLSYRGCGEMSFFSELGEFDIGEN